MTVSRQKRGRAPGLAPGFLLIGLIIAWVMALPSAALAGQEAGAAKALKPGYVGIAACTREACHTKQATAYLTSKHGRASNSDAPAAADECESCHGAGQAHMNDTKAKGLTASLSTMPARAASAVCLTCHEKGDRGTFTESIHARRNVACMSCHSVHSSTSARNLLKTKTDDATCFSCHKAERAKTMRTSHHPIAEGKMGCVSCHNPHDGSRPKMLLADSVNELCYKCHTEKRGPFLYEHAAVREDCASCHDPHGSNHPRMLQAKPPQLCQRCHYSGHGITFDLANTLAGPAVAAPSPAAAVSPTGAVVAQTVRSSRQMEHSCKNCHLAIHGSNSPSGQFFVR